MTISPDSQGELRLAFTLAAVIAMRMLGLFLILPVFMVLAREMPGFTPLLGGLAVGAYGLTQAVLQQPFGWLSDIWGRRRILLLGLAIFALGGVVAALADTITGVIVGRCLQGGGAIAGVALAFAADNIRPARRSLANAIIGMAIGGAFLLALVVSVPLANLVGLNGLFWLTAALAVVGMGLILTTPKTGRTAAVDAQHEESNMPAVWLLSSSVFLLHGVMTQLFVVLPGLWVDQFGFALPEHWKIYLPTMLGSVLVILPVLAWSGRKAAEKTLLIPGFSILGLSLVFMGRAGDLAWLAWLLLFCFVALNILEAIMPALVSRYVGVGGRGRRLGLYSTFQFLGAFSGGVSGGWILGKWGASAALVSAATICLFWSLVIGLLSRGVFRTSPIE